MLKSLVCLLAVSAFSFSAFAAEPAVPTKFNFSGDAYVRGYMKNSTGDQGTQAFAQFFRLNVDAKPDDNLVVKTGLVLAGETWEGDNHLRVNRVTNPVTGTISPTLGTAIDGTNDDGTGNGDVAHLDHAQIEYTKNGWITSVGRMAVTSPGSFLTSDDRRDRIQVVKIFENYHALALVYDKRAEGSLSNAKDDLDMYSANYYGVYEGYKFAIQTGYWKSKTFSNTTSAINMPVNLDNIKQVTPQFEGTLGGVSFNLYYTFLFGGSAFFKDEHHSLALKLSKDFDIFKVEAQSMLTRDGGLIAGGFDSLSSIINNSPDHNQSLIKLRTIGSGLGSKNVDEHFSAIRFSKQITEEFSASLGGGLGKMYANFLSPKENNTVVDATARYSISKNLALTGLYGHMFGDFKDHAGSLTLSAVF